MEREGIKSPMFVGGHGLLPVLLVIQIVLIVNTKVEMSGADG